MSILLACVATQDAAWSKPKGKKNQGEAGTGIGSTIPAPTPTGTVAVTGTAAAAPIWTHSLDRGNWLHSPAIGPSGEVAVQHCDAAGPALTVLNKDGIEIWSLTTPGTETTFCIGPGVFDQAGNLYLFAWDSSGGPFLRSYSPTGVQRWQTAIDRPWSVEWGVILGADGNIYLVDYNPFQPPPHLKGFRASDGTLILDISLGHFGDGPGNLLATSDGLYIGGFGVNEYFSYTGQSLAGPYFGGFPHWEIASPGENGIVFRLDDDGPSCNLQKMTPSGAVWAIPLGASDCTIQPLVATPDGGAVRIEMQTDEPNSSLIVRAFSAAGLPRWTTTVDAPKGWWASPYLSQAGVDVHGNIAFAATYKYVDGCDLPPCWGGSVMVLDTAGNLIFRQEFESANSSRAFVQGGLTVDTDRLYFVVEYPDASQGWRRELTALSLPQLGQSFLDKVLHPIGAAEEPEEYVALGDSYSAGTGVPPYDPGTHTSSNQCHRSGGAYPRLFATTEGLSITHLACHGARLPQLWNQLADVAPLGSAVSLMSLTIGGNDVGFADVLISCMSSLRCDRRLDKTVDRDMRALKEQLPTLYADIADDIREAEVFVMGYPDFLPRKPTGRVLRQLDKHELTWLRSVAAQLNSVISKAVHDRVNGGDPDFHFVNVFKTFEGHEACGPNEWVHCIVAPHSHGEELPTPHESFHPNALGHTVMARCLHEAVEAAETKFKCDAPA